MPSVTPLTPAVAKARLARRTSLAKRGYLGPEEVEAARRALHAANLRSQIAKNSPLDDADRAALARLLLTGAA